MYQAPSNFDNFTFRSHYMGELMTPAKAKSFKQQYDETLNSYQNNLEKYMEAKDKTTKTAKAALEMSEKMKAKSDELKPKIDIPFFSESCQNRLIQIYTEVTTGRTKNIQSKYMEKGLHVEEDAITLYSLLNKRMFKKNTVRLDNGYINGEMDFEDGPDISVDAKSNWDVFTFDKTAIKKIDKNYEWQGQCYMWLFNKKIHRIAYCLLNTPDFLIKGQLRKIENELPEDQWAEAKQEVMRLNIYDDLPIERKVRTFEIKRSDDAIDQIKANVPKWRYFLNNINKLNLSDDE